MAGEVVSDMGGKSRAVLEDSLSAVVPAAFTLHPCWATTPCGQVEGKVGLVD